MDYYYGSSQIMDGHKQYYSDTISLLIFISLTQKSTNFDEMKSIRIHHIQLRKKREPNSYLKFVSTTLKIFTAIGDSSKKRILIHIFHKITQKYIDEDWWYKKLFTQTTHKK